MAATIGIRTTQHPFIRGFAAMFPFWIGAIPVGVAFSIAARQAGLSGWEAQAMCLLVFTAAGQIAAVAAIGDGSTLPLIILTIIALNVQLIMLGLAAGRQFRARMTEWLPASLMLTDGAYAVAMSLVPPTLTGLCGAGASMYLAWNLGTGIGLLSGTFLLGIGKETAGFIAPLMFVAVLAPFIRQRATVATVVAAALGAAIAGTVAPAGICVLAGGAVGALAGVTVARREQV